MSLKQYERILTVVYAEWEATNDDELLEIIYSLRELIKYYHRH